MGTKIPRKQSSGGSVAGMPRADAAEFDSPSEEPYCAHREVEALKHRYQETCGLPSIAYFTLDVHGRVIEADATEMAQPRASNFASAMRSPSSLR